MGTPQFAVHSLEQLLQGDFDVVAVFTQPDRRRGRGHQVTFSPVKQRAIEADIPVYQPSTLRDEEVQAELARLAPDVIVVVAFGQLLPRAVLKLPPLGCINVHASLLPRHRGAAPIQAALRAGDEMTGVTTMFMDEGLDTGDMILRHEVLIRDDDDAGTLHDRLAEGGAALLVDTLTRLGLGTAPRVPQTEAQATYAPRLTKDDPRIDWSVDALHVVNHVRAFAPRPGAYTDHRGRTMKVLGARMFASDDGAPGTGATVEPGAVVGLRPDGFVVRTGSGDVLVTKVQPAGRGPMTGRDYSNGFRLEIGERLGAP